MKRTHQVIAAGFFALVLAVGWAVVTANGSSVQSRPRKAVLAEGGAKPGSLPVDLRKASRAEGICHQARVSKVARDRAILFVVRCRGPKEGGLVRFAVQAMRPHSVAAVPLSSYSRHPELDGSGAQAKRGVCVKSGSIVGCRGRSRGAVRVSGRLWPENRSACAVSVLVSAIHPSGCRRGVCQGPLKGRVLARGRPRGC